MSYLGKTPLEAKLERENSMLRAELQFYKERDTERYSIFEEPQKMLVDSRHAGDTLRLAISGGWRRGDDALQANYGYHIWTVDRTQPKEYRLNYFISDFNLMMARDRAMVMQKSLEEASRHLENYLDHP
jgi:hypothetical protein